MGDNANVVQLFPAGHPFHRRAAWIVSPGIAASTLCVRISFVNSFFGMVYPKGVTHPQILRYVMPLQKVFKRNVPTPIVARRYTLE